MKHFSKGIAIKYLSKIVKLSLTPTTCSLFFHFSHGCILFLCFHGYTFTPSINNFQNPKATSIGESHTLFAMLCVVHHPQNIRAPWSHMSLSIYKLGTLQCCVVLPFCERNLWSNFNISKFMRRLSPDKRLSRVLPNFEPFGFYHIFSNSIIFWLGFWTSSIYTLHIPQC